MVEMKEGIPVNPESSTIASISHSGLQHDLWHYMAGEPEEQDEISLVYDINSFDVPPHCPCLCRHLPMCVFHTQQKKFCTVHCSIEEEIVILINDGNLQHVHNPAVVVLGVYHADLGPRLSAFMHLHKFKVSMRRRKLIDLKEKARGKQGNSKMGPANVLS